MQLLDEMRMRDMAPNAVSFTAAVSACKRGGQWRRAVQVLSEMDNSAVAPDLVAFGAGMSACERGKLVG